MRRQKRNWPKKAWPRSKPSRIDLFEHTNAAHPQRGSAITAPSFARAPANIMASGRTVLVIAPSEFVRWLLIKRLDHHPPAQGRGPLRPEPKPQSRIGGPIQPSLKFSHQSVRDQRLTFRR